jgi:hypothetical protein
MPEQQNIEYKSSWHDDYLDWILQIRISGQKAGIAGKKRATARFYCLLIPDMLKFEKKNVKIKMLNMRLTMSDKCRICPINVG